MAALQIEISGWESADQPGFVRCRLRDALGQDHWFVEKVPIVTAADLCSASTYPQPGWIDCQVVDRRYDSAGRLVLAVTTERPWGVCSTAKRMRFNVFESQLQEP